MPCKSDIDIIEAHSKYDVPAEPHYAVIVYKKHTSTYTDYSTDNDCCEHWVTTNRDAWECKIKQLHAQREKFVAFEVSKIAEVQTQVVIK
jgi:hypothetical protein